jgi:hypothetical protein
MTINVAFKSPDAVVFATDGLASVFDVDPHGHESFLSSMAEVEKLVALDEPPTLAMFNGVGSLGRSTLAAELRAIAAKLHARRPALSSRRWVDEIAGALWRRARAEHDTPPAPLHLIFGGFERGAPRGPRGAVPAPASPVLYEIKWWEGMPWTDEVPSPQPVLAVERAGVVDHLYGSYYAGATAAVSRFVEGFDPELQQHLALALAGAGNGAGPGILEELVRLVHARDPAAAPLPPADLEELVLRYTRRILRAAFPAPTPLKLAEHFSLQAAVDYVVFLAQCAYARENLSPTRRGPPRVGSTLQVAYLERGKRPTQLTRIQLDVRLQGHVRPVPGEVRS